MTERATTTTSQDQHAESQRAALAHVVPLRVLLAVWAALVLLTWITVAVAHVDLGNLNLWIAMTIATVKASLVALYFMHLRYDKPFYGVILVGALLFVMLFIGLAMMDTLAYEHQLIPGYAPELQR
jgi:cytochrome c oxidase subunit 4